jgi:signal transduction histidine kinase
MRIRTLSPAARFLFFATITGGVAAAAIRVADVSRWDGSDLLALAGLAAAILVTELFSVPLRLRTETLNFMLTDAAYIAGLILVRPSVLTFALVAGVFTGQLLKRWDVRKVAFNVGVYLVGITGAQFIVRAVAGFAPLAAREPRTWVAAVLGMGGFAVANVVLVSGIISLVLVERKSFARVVAPTLGLEAAHRAGNVAIGLTFAVLYKVNALALPPAALIVGLAFIAYQGWVAAISERDRLRVLHEVESRLLNPLDVAAEMEPILQLVKRMLGAASVELSMFDGDEVLSYSSEGTPAAVAAGGNGNGHRAGGDEESSQIAMVGGTEGVTGMLIIRRNRPLADSERAVLESVASRISVMLRNNRLFMETLEQAELADVVSHTWDGIFVASQEGRIVSWNPSMERITGIAREDALGRSCLDVLGFEPVIDLTDTDAYSRNGYENGHGALGGSALVRGLGHMNGHATSGGSRDIVVTHADGTERWVRYTYRPLGSRGVRAGHVVVVRDVTAELETEQLKADFVATVSHELRTPLTPLKGFLITLARGIGDGTQEERQAYYRIMLNQANRLERLITDLLEASRIESGQPVVKSRPMNLTDTIDEVVRMFQEEYPDRAIRPVVDGPVMVDADPLRVDQVLTNLVSNAIKYSPRESAIDVRVAKENGQATISVRDQGWGIAPGDQERVFDRFFRVENALTRRTGGTGLGLYLAKQLVQAMRGRLWVASRPGEGSTFSFTLPLAEHSGPASGKDGAVSVSA